MKIRSLIQRFPIASYFVLAYLISWGGSFAIGGPKFLRGEPLVTGYENHGALFECVRLPEGLDADRFSAYLVTHHDTCVVPGSFFGLPGHVRIGLAPSTGGLDEGLSRLSAALRAYPSAVD